MKQLPDSEFQAFAKTATPQGVLALFSPQADTSPPPPLPPFALVLDRIADPGNLGTILRTAWAVGLQHVWLTSGTADPLAPKTIRAGMGAQFALTLHTGKPLSALKGTLAEQGFLHMWISTPGGGVSCCSDQFSPLGSALVIGNEANGATTVSGADFVTIPMPGQAESLNVSQAATILLYETVRRGLFA